MTPTEASKKENEAVKYKKLYPKENKGKIQTQKFHLNDNVRITVKRGDFRKGYLPNFTDEIFIISNVQNTQPITYKLKDLHGEVIEGSFYEQEMVKVK